LAVIGWVAGVTGLADVADVEGVAGVAGVAEVADSIHINSMVLFFFLFHLFLVHPIILSYYHTLSISSYHPIIFEYFLFLISCFIFSKNAVHINSLHSVRKMFQRTEWVSSDPVIF
jgi:hypothetical protein